MNEDKLGVIRYRLLGQINQGKRLVGYRVLKENDFSIMNMSEEETIRLIKTHGVINAKIDTDGKVIGTQGAISRLPVFSYEGELIGNPRVTILAVEVSNKGNKRYLLIDPYGRVNTADTNQTIEIIKSRESTNAKLVNKDGKVIISAIMGEFRVIDSKTKKSVTDTTVNKAIKVEDKEKLAEDNKAKKWERDYSDARYIGKTKTTRSANLYEKVLRCRRLRKKLDDNYKLNVYDVVMVSYGLNTNIKKLLQAVSTGKVGKRTKKHYEYTLKLLKDSGNMGKEALNMLELKKALDSTKYGRDIISKEDGRKYLKFVETFCIDCLNYNRVVLSKEYLKDLVRYITSNDEAMKYIQENTDISQQGKDVIEAIKLSSKSRIDSISSVMFICALEILSLSRTEKDKFKKIGVERTIGNVAYILHEEPVKIESKNEYGAMIFQALIIAMAMGKK